MGKIIGWTSTIAIAVLLLGIATVAVVSKYPDCSEYEGGAHLDCLNNGGRWPD